MDAVFTRNLPAANPCGAALVMPALAVRKRNLECREFCAVLKKCGEWVDSLESVGSLTLHFHQEKALGSRGTLVRQPKTTDADQ